MGITSKNASAGLSVATPRRMCEVHMKEKKKSLDGSIRTRRDEKVNKNLIRLKKKRDLAAARTRFYHIPIAYALQFPRAPLAKFPKS